MENKEEKTALKFCESCGKDLPLERFKRDPNRKSHAKIKEGICTWCWGRMIKNHGPANFYGRRKVKEYTPEEIKEYQKTVESRTQKKPKQPTYKDL